MQNIARIVSVRTAVPELYYTQEQVYELMPNKNDTIKRIFQNGGIKKRHLYLPPLDTITQEDQGRLLDKHRIYGVKLGEKALLEALSSSKKKIQDLSLICCVTSTGFLTPSLSAYITNSLSLGNGCHRLDIVGMGCNAGLNAMNVVSNWAANNPGKLAALLCIEICSAAYTIDRTPRTAIVNSLFGDGAAAALIKTEKTDLLSGPKILDFSSLLIEDTLSGLRYDWEQSACRFNFYIDKMIPEVIGRNIKKAIAPILKRHKICTSEIDYWFVHAGGKRVLDVLQAELDLPPAKLWGSRLVLENYGNVSSASFLFAYEFMLKDLSTREGDLGLMITMGPGCCIEVALLSW